MKLNIGCGNDYRADFINIDIDSNLVHTDLVLDISNEDLLDNFQENSVDQILALDIIEHLYRWQAIQVFHNCFIILQKNGTLTIRVPDFERIITSNHTNDKKIQLLFGGQDIPQTTNNDLRKKNPEFFCHRYAWTKKSLSIELQSIGYQIISQETRNTNIILKSIKL